MDARPAPAAPPACPVRGHDHPLDHVRQHTQTGTGDTAHTWGCPTGAYRWFVLAGRQPSNKVRQTRPRYGWKD
jgi:hypothetical protein